MTLAGSILSNRNWNTDEFALRTTSFFLEPHAKSGQVLEAEISKSVSKASGGVTRGSVESQLLEAQDLQAVPTG